MKFIPLASSSRGNAYLLQDEGVQPLLLEAGIPIKQLRAKLREHGVSLSDLAGACVSHSHADHCKSVKDLLKAGVDAFMSTGTAKDLDVYSHHRCHSFGKAPVSGNISHWKVTTFPLEHDSSEPIGFLVDHGDERLGFIPDTQLVVNRFESPTIIAIETNYQEEILHENISKGYIPSVVGRRVRRSHLSLETVKKFLLANDLSRCSQIWLLHLSDGNSSEKEMIKEIQEATGIPVRVAQQ